MGGGRLGEWVGGGQQDLKFARPSVLSQLETRSGADLGAGVRAGCATEDLEA